ncbi:MAG: GNAT family N-acetyltransferase [Sphingobium sp.]|nr:GNAT family N-acetyltransferase [Sphingobium sp.]
MSGTIRQEVIRLARPEEKAALEGIQRRASLVWEEYRADLLANPEVFDIPSAQIADGRVLVVEREGGLAGFSAVEWRDDGDADLDGLFVEPPLWRQQLGTRLVEAASALARDKGCRALHVVGNPYAEGFYLRCGFQRTGLVETRFGTGIAMIRALMHA